MAEKRFEITVDGKKYHVSLPQDQWDRLYAVDPSLIGEKNARWPGPDGNKSGRLYNDQEVWQKLVQSDVVTQAIAGEKQRPAPPTSQKDQAIGAALQLQDILWLSYGDELAGYMAYAAALAPGGKTPVEAYRETTGDIRRRLERERRERPIGSAAIDVAGSLVGAKGGMKIAEEVLQNPTLAKLFRFKSGPFATTGTGATTQAAHVTPRTAREAAEWVPATSEAPLLSKYSFMKTFPGRKVPSALTRVRSGPSLRTAATTGGYGAAGAGAYGFYSGEGGGPLEETPGYRDRLGRWITTAPFGFALGAGLSMTPAAASAARHLRTRLSSALNKERIPVARVRPEVAERLGLNPEQWYPFKGEEGYPAVRIGDKTVNRSDIEIRMPGEAEPVPTGPERMETEFATPEDYDRGAEVAAATRLRDSLIGEGPTTIRREGLRDEVMLGDEGVFDPITLHAAMQAGGETAASAAARARLASRAEQAAQESMLPMEGYVQPVRAETAEGLIAPQREAADIAYTTARESGDIVPIKKGLFLDRLRESVHFNNVFEAARLKRTSVERGDPLLDQVGHDYPKTKEELLGGYRNITEGDVKRYEAAGWEIKVTTKSEKVGGEMVEVEMYRAIDPNGPNLKARQVNELSQQMQGMAEREQVGSGDFMKFVDEFNTEFIRKPGGRLEAAGRTYDERLRLEEVTAGREGESPVLKMRPAEIERHIEYTGRGVTDKLPFGTRRSNAQKIIIIEEGMDAIARDVIKHEGIPPQELIDRAQVLISHISDNPHAFRMWKDAVTRAKEYKLSKERVGTPFKPMHEFKESFGEKVGGFGRRMAEFFFSAPFAATRALDRALSSAAKIRNQAINDAVVDMLTKVGKQREAANRLIMEKVNAQIISASDKRILGDIIRIATGRAVAPISEQAGDMPIVGPTVRGTGMGLLMGGMQAKKLIPF
jgi:hypothetical protein